MGKYSDLFDEAKEKAGEYLGVAKEKADEYLGGAKEKADEYFGGAKGKAGDYLGGAFGGAREKVSGILQDSRAGKEIKEAISALEAMPVFEDSIVHRMELESMISDLKGLLLVIGDKRLDAETVALEIKKVIVKVQPSAEPAAEPAAEPQAAASAAEPQAEPAGDLDSVEQLIREIKSPDPVALEQQAIDKAKAIVFDACIKALDAIS